MATTRKRLTISDLCIGDTVGLDVEGYEYIGEFRGTVYSKRRERAVVVTADGTRYDIPLTLIGRVWILRTNEERLVVEEEWPLLEPRREVQSDLAVLRQTWPVVALCIVVWGVGILYVIWRVFLR